MSFNSINFIIVGDKYQKGMKSKGCPGLIKFNKHQTIFEHQYDTIKKTFDSAKIIYIGGFESKKIENFLCKKYKDVVVINNKEYEIYNDSYSLSLASEYLSNNTFIMFGYTILTSKTFDKFNHRSGSQIFLSKNIITNIGCIINNNQIDNISFDLPNYIQDIYYISNTDIVLLQTLLSNQHYKNYFIFEIINKLIDNGSIIKPFFTKSLKNHYYEYIK